MSRGALCVCLLTSWTLLLQGAAGVLSELYFSNNNDIMRLTNGSSTVVIPGLKVVDTIECNICDRMIYWVDQNPPVAIRRALPGNASSVETILDRDLDHPKGLAVDWVGNNIYFSHGNRIEVATCDGQHRKVLRNDIRDVGPIAIDLTTGYLYYVAELFFVHRMMLNGSSDEEFMYIDTPQIVGIEMDVVNQVLYWTNENDHASKRLDLTAAVRQIESISTDSIAYKLVIHRNTLYWTELNQVDQTTSEIDRPGALYSMGLGSGDMEEVLLRNYTLNPQDLCIMYFFEMNVSENSCAVNNGDCDVLCLTVPSPGGGTEPQCACPTGIPFSPDGDTCLPYPNEFLLFTQRHASVASNYVSHTDVRLISLDAPPFFVDTHTSVTVPLASARFIAYDVVTLLVYWSQLDPPQIRRAPVYGTEGEEEVVIQTSISLPESLAIDAYAMNLYWVDSALDKVEVVGIGETNRYRKVLVQTGRKPQGLALDLLNRFMYWTDLDNSAPRVERCHMDGTNCTQILTHLPPNTIREPATITVDPLSSWVYFAETQRDRVFRYNGLTGSHSEEKLIDPMSGTAPTDVSGLAVHGNYLYWTDRSGNGVSMARVDKVEFTGSETVLNTGGLHGLLAVDHSASLPPTMCSLCEQLCLSPSCACADHFILDTSTQGSCLEPPATLLVGSTVRGVFQFTENVASNNWIQKSLTPILNINVDRMDVDFSTTTLFWVSNDDKLVYRNSLDNTSLPAEQVVHCCVGEIRDLAVDWFGRNLYWVDSARHVIEVAQLDGRHRIVLYNVPPSLGTLNIITLDPLRGHLYWSPGSGAKIYRWRMDGSSTMSPDTFWESHDYTEVFGLALNYTADAGISDQLYFGVYSNDRSDSLYSQEVDDEDNLSLLGQFDSAVKDLYTYKGDSYVIGGGTFPTVVKVHHNDSTNNHNNAATLITPFEQPLSTLSLAVSHHSLQPGLHECGVDNRGCGGGAVCLVETGVRGACVCPPLQASTIKTDSDGINRITCAAPGTFVLLATENGVYLLPYVSSSIKRSTSKVQPLPLPVVGSIRSLTYDPINKSVLFTDDTSQLHSVSLDSTFDYSYPLVNDSAPYSLAYDWRGGHIFTATSPGFQIELTTINGEGVGSVLEFQGTEKRYVLNILGELLFDTDRRRLYWTYVAHNKELDMVVGAELRYMDLSDTTRTMRSIDLGGRSIRNITLEPEGGSIYWVSIFNTRSVIIERFFPNNGTILSVHSAAASLAGLAVTVVNSQPLLFWYDTAEEAIFLHDGRQVVRYRGWSSGGARIVGMLAHTTMPLPVNLPCLDAERPCSHYCLSDPHSLAVRCSCPSNTQLENSITCSDVHCGNSLWSCGGDSSECYPRTYLCDNIPHCRNGADETCNCSRSDFGCYLSETGDECVAMELKCDGITHCSHGEDEMDCCATNQFGCYIEDDTYKPLGGGSVIRYHCLYNSSRCDGMVDCLNQTIDEPLDCRRPTTMTTDTTMTTPPSTAIIIIFSVVVSIFIAMIIILFCCYFGGRYQKSQLTAGLKTVHLSRSEDGGRDETDKTEHMPTTKVESIV